MCMVEVVKIGDVKLMLPFTNNIKLYLKTAFCDFKLAIETYIANFFIFLLLPS